MNNIDFKDFREKLMEMADREYSSQYIIDTPGHVDYYQSQNMIDINHAQQYLSEMERKRESIENRYRELLAVYRDDERNPIKKIEKIFASLSDFDNLNNNETILLKDEIESIVTILNRATFRIEDGIIGKNNIIAHNRDIEINKLIKDA